MEKRLHIILIDQLFDQVLFKQKIKLVFLIFSQLINVYIFFEEIKTQKKFY